MNRDRKGSRMAFPQQNVVAAMDLGQNKPQFYERFDDVAACERGERFRH